MCEQYSSISGVTISSFNDKIGILFRKGEAAEEALKCDGVEGSQFSIAGDALAFSPDLRDNGSAAEGCFLSRVGPCRIGCSKCRLVPALSFSFIIYSHRI